MDLNKYVKIEGGFEELMECLKAGMTVHLRNSVAYKLDENGNLISDYRRKNHFTKSSLEFNLMVDAQWYVKEPFDVRQAMRDRPNEWVGMFYDGDPERTRIKVGFDSERCIVVKALYGFEGTVQETETATWKYLVPTVKQLNSCIPIEDVPKDGLRDDV